MFYIKENTDKNFNLGWYEDHPGHEHHWSPSGPGGASSPKGKTTIAGFGGIEYALKFLNGEIKVEGKPSRTPDFAGVADGPMSKLSFWFRHD